MKRRGFLADPERFKLLRRVKMLNELRPLLRSLCGRGEMPMWATTPTWVQKSTLIVSEIAQRAREMMKGTWEKLVGSRPQERTGPDLER